MITKNDAGRTNYYAGADWIQRCLEHGMSPLGRDVADLLGEAWCGIYHLYESQRSVRRTDWSDSYCIELSVPTSGLATFDLDRLTRLVFLAHDRAIRIELCGSAPRLVKLQFHRRNGREGRLSERHPSVEQALAQHRERYPEDDQ